MISQGMISDVMMVVMRTTLNLRCMTLNPTRMELPSTLLMGEDLKRLSNGPGECDADRGILTM
jgi:hypothetical protein